MPPDISFFVALEHRIWQALVHGDAEADARLLDPRFVGVYTSGFASREDHAAQLAEGPSVSDYSIDEPGLLLLAPTAVLLTYRATFTRPARTGAPAAQTMYVSSVWKQVGKGWVNVFSQDTPASGTARPASK